MPVVNFDPLPTRWLVVLRAQDRLGERVVYLESATAYSRHADGRPITTIAAAVHVGKPATGRMRGTKSRFLIIIGTTALRLLRSICLSTSSP